MSMRWSRTREFGAAQHMPEARHRCRRRRGESQENGGLFAQGLGVEKDEAEAAKWARKSADQGLGAGQFGLGTMYAHGRGVPKSEREAATWYRKAAQ